MIYKWSSLWALIHTKLFQALLFMQQNWLEPYPEERKTPIIIPSTKVAQASWN